MLYNVENKQEMLDTLQAKVSSIIDMMLYLVTEGYVINKSKPVRVRWGTIMIHAVQNMDILSEEQQHKLEELYDKII